MKQLQVIHDLKFFQVLLVYDEIILLQYTKINCKPWSAIVLVLEIFEILFSVFKYLLVIQCYIFFTHFWCKQTLVVTNFNDLEFCLKVCFFDEFNFSLKNSEAHALDWTNYDIPLLAVSEQNENFYWPSLFFLTLISLVWVYKMYYL